MKKIVLFDPGVGSLNKGDEVISDAVKKNLSPILNKNFVVSVSTHNPLNLVYIKHLMNYDYKFVCGSNLLMGKMNGLFRQWDIGLKSLFATKNCILVGAGWWKANDKPNLYTRWFYRKIFNKKFLHSVRDEYTKNMLEKIGIKNVVNTGCPTMWDFTPDFCKQIPKLKSSEVVFTLTDYNKDKEKDRKLIITLLNNYKKVYFWPQGDGDYDYLNEFNLNKKIEILSCDLNEYNNFLHTHDCDYVGTRLHGGIRALQYKKRSIIIAIDNRAREKKKDFNIPCIERNNIDKLDSMINSSFSTDIVIPLENIKKWKNQFNELNGLYENED